MLAVISYSLLVRVEDEEDAAEKAAKLSEAALMGSEASVEIEALNAGLSPEDFEEVKEVVEQNVGFLGSQVLMLPDKVLEGRMP